MPFYRISNRKFYFPLPIAEIHWFEVKDGIAKRLTFASFPFQESENPRLISCVDGWVAGKQRCVDVYGVTSGSILLKVAECGEFLITHDGESISKRNMQDAFSQLDCEIIFGPALILALAMRGTWSLHASAAMFREKTIAFLGESGQGKSTLAAYLAQYDGWLRVADDILPATVESSGVNVWPHFPQLKLPPEAQPYIGLPEHLPLDKICLLAPAEIDNEPTLEQVSPAQAAQIILSHTAGARMFPPDLLARHLDFCVEAAKCVPVYRLTYPHRREALPVVKSLLESIG